MTALYGMVFNLRSHAHGLVSQMLMEPTKQRVSDYLPIGSHDEQVLWTTILTIMAISIGHFDHGTIDVRSRYAVLFSQLARGIPWSH